MDMWWRNSVWYAAMLVAVSWACAFGAACGSGGCATVRTQVRNIHGCDVDDAKAIVTASAAIVAAAAEAKAGGDKAVAMVKVIEQLAVIRERWKHCKETANKNGTSLGATASLSSLVDARASPFVDVGLDEGGIDVVTLAELLADE